jgi:uncharacterized integral membrane protein
MAMDEVPGGAGGAGGAGAAAEHRRAIGGGAIAAISGGAVLVIFMLQNREDVTVEFLAWSFTWPLWLLILVAATFGALVWLGLGIVRRHRRRVERRADRRD